jgi:hypothetical protein
VVPRGGAIPESKIDSGEAESIPRGGVIPETEDDFWEGDHGYFS